ncbi:MAG: hypothetical protein N2037_06905 [Acidimicrobiales bacterium]|nr:hypothetical protein [Acidimicrobiales bacterium]
MAKPETGDDGGSSQPGSGSSNPRPIMARCLSCAAQFPLGKLAETRDGRCPGCRQHLSPGWTTLLVEEAENIETLRQAFVRALRRMAGLPGTLEILPDVILEDLDAIPWQRNILTEPTSLVDEIQKVRDRLEGLDPAIAVSDQTVDEANQLRADLQALSNRFIRLGQLLDAHQEAVGIRDATAGQKARRIASELAQEADAVIDRGRPRDVANRLEQADEAAEAARQQAVMHPQTETD